MYLYICADQQVTWYISLLCKLGSLKQSSVPLAMSMPIIQILISNYLMKATKTLWKVIDFDSWARNTQESLEHLVMLEIILKKQK